MREILFRGKQIDDGKWVYGFIVRYLRAVQIGDYSTWYIVVPPKDPDDSSGWYNVVPDTVGQYTGLLDKNGDKIFEGDIVRLFNQTGKVVLECGTFGIDIFPDTVNWDFLEKQIPLITLCDNTPRFCENDNLISLWELMENFNQEEGSCDVVEVIGNVHDNPELLNTSNPQEIEHESNVPTDTYYFEIGV